MAYTEYYKEFPYEDIMRLLEPVRPYSEPYPIDDNPISRRELAFTYSISKNGKVENVFQRYQSFKADSEQSVLVQFSRKLVNSRPIKIEIGPVYSLEPQTTRKCDSRVDYRELIFDLDITPEYNELRNCPCVAEPSPSFLCKLCWPFITVGVHCLDYLLRTHFGYEDLLWSFSGRRGVHCQVLDPRASILSEDARRSLANFFERLWRADQQCSVGPFLDPRRLYLDHLYHTLLLPRFERLVETTALNLSCGKMLTIIANCFSGTREALAIKQFLDGLVQKPCASTEVWTQLRLIAAQFSCQHHLPKVVFAAIFPKLDLGVTKGVNHLLRCPMSVHHETDNIAVPLLVDQIDDLDPARFPCLRKRQTMLKLNEWKADFADCLRCRHSIANYLTCMHCAETVQELNKLPQSIMFSMDVSEWRVHQQAMHPGSSYTADASTLRALVNRRSRRPDGLQDWAVKVECYRQLDKKFG